MKTSLFILLTALIFLTGASSLYAQEHRVKHGLHFGLASSTLQNGDGPILPDRQDQFFFGYYRESRFLGLLKFKVGLQFLQLGAKEQDIREIKLSYLNIPAALKLKIGPFYGEAGFSGGIRLSADEFEGGRKVETKGRYNTWDGGYFFSVGAELLIFFVEFRQTYGRVGVIDDYFSKYWQVGGGIRF